MIKNVVIPGGPGLNRSSVHLAIFVKDDFKIVAVLRMRPQKPGPCVTAAWHDKDPTYKKQKAKLLQPLTDNGKVFI